MRDRKRINASIRSSVPAGGRGYADPGHPLLILQRLAGNRVVQQLLGVQRHALNLDELTDESIEQDLPVQRVPLATPGEVPLEEHDRLTREGTRITNAAQAAVSELAATKGDANKPARHVGKAFQRGLLVEPSPIVRVNHLHLPEPRQREVEDRGEDFRWFWWNRSGAEDYVIEHRMWGGGLQTFGQVNTGGGVVGIGVRDVAANDRTLLKKILVHEAVHQMQWKQRVQQTQTMEARYRREFEAYWVSGEMPQIRPPDRRAEAISTHIVGVDAQDPNTVYPELRDWYHGLAPGEQARIRAIRIGTVGGLAWWQMNVHIQELLGPLGTAGQDADRLAVWNKLSRSEKRQALSDPVLAAKLRRTVGTLGSAFARAVRA